MPTLEERVAALEERSGADSIAITFLTIDAQGNVSANFTGVVHALGLHLDEPVLGIGGSPGKTNEIYWDNPGVTGGQVDAVISSVLRPLVPTFGVMDLRQLSPAGTIAEMQLHADDTPASSLVTLVAGPASANILYGDGRMDLGILPRVKVNNPNAQATVNATVLLLPYAQEDFDKGTPNGDMHDNAANNDRLTCRMAGTYLAGVTVQWAGNAVGARQVNIFKNGVLVPGGDNVSAPVNGAQTTQSATAFVELAAGDFLQSKAFQSSGGGLNIQTATFWAIMLGA